MLLKLHLLLLGIKNGIHATSVIILLRTNMSLLRRKNKKSFYLQSIGHRALTLDLISNTQNTVQNAGL